MLNWRAQLKRNEEELEASKPLCRKVKKGANEHFTTLAEVAEGNGRFLQVSEGCPPEDELLEDVEVAEIRDTLNTH